MITRAKRLLVVLALALVFTLVASAQDASQLLQLRVGYGTLKNSTTLTAEKSAEIDRLEKQATEASAAGRYGEAMKHLYHGMAVMRGEEWTGWRALDAALRVKVERAMLEPAQAARLQLSEIFVPDEKLQGTIKGAIVLLPPQGKGDVPLKTLKSLDALAPDRVAAPLAVEVPVPEVEDGNYRLAVILESPAGKPITKSAAVHVERGLAARVAAARARQAKIETKLKGNGSAALEVALPSVEYHMALYDLASAASVNLQRIDFKNEIQEAAAQLDALEAGRNPFATRRGDFRKAYRSKIDDTLQPYRVFVPSSYDGSKPYPLVVALHGMGGDENAYFDGYNDGLFKTEAERRGYIVACPKGRDPASMYTGPAEQDVMDVVAEVMRDYRVDPDRVYLTGHSMGGYGSWSVAMNHPEVFAAIAPIAGGGNPANLPKLARVPQLVVHGDADRTVPVERSRVMVETARKLGQDVKYIEVPGGSHTGVAAPTFKDVFDWFDAHRRPTPPSAPGKPS